MRVKIFNTIISVILLLCVVALGYDFHNIGLESASLYILGVTLIFHGLYKRNYYSLSIPVLLIPLVYLNSIMVLPVLFLITLFIEFLSLKDLKINVGLSLMCLMSLMFLFIVTVLNSYNYEVDLLVNPVRWIESVPHFHNIFLVTFCVSSIGLISSKISNLNHESFIDFFTLLVTTIALYFAYSFSHIDNLLMGSIVFAGLMFSYEKNSTIFLNKVYNIIPIILAIILADNFITVISILSVIVLIRTIDAQSKLLKLIPFIVLTHFVFIKGVSDSKYVEILYFSSFLLMILNVRLKQVFRNVRYE